MSVLGEITHEQLANAEIIIGFDGTSRMYEDFMIEYFSKTEEEPIGVFWEKRSPFVNYHSGTGIERLLIELQV